MKKLGILVLVNLIALVSMAREWEGMNNGRYGGCVVEGTMVTLADGSQKAIEKVLETDRVLSTTEESFGPLLRIRGPEKADLFHLQTKSGKEVTATEGHPFISINRRILTSKEFKVGMYIQTEDGPEILTKVELVKGDKVVYNLILASDEALEEMYDQDTEAKKMGFSNVEFQRRLDPFLGLKSVQHSFYVNGIASGDLVIQQAIKN